MDLNKSLEFFDPGKVRERITIIGCGSVGSAVATLLVRAGITNITLYDDDTVEPHNLCNQLFDSRHIGWNKAEALARMLIDINPDASSGIRVVMRKYIDQPLSGYVFLCVDSVDVRRSICEANEYNAMIKAVFDCRTGLKTGETRAAEWDDPKAVDQLLKSMQFTHAEAKAEAPTNACGMVLGVMSTVWMVCLLCVNNFITLINEKKYKKVIFMNAFENGGSVLAM